MKAPTAQERPTRRSTQAADRADLQIKGIRPPPDYLGCSIPSNHPFLQCLEKRPFIGTAAIQLTCVGHIDRRFETRMSGLNSQWFFLVGIGYFGLGNL
jgi:hypothetical protein